MVWNWCLVRNSFSANNVPLQDFSSGQLGMRPAPSFPISSKSCLILFRIKGWLLPLITLKFFSHLHQYIDAELLWMTALRSRVLKTFGPSEMRQLQSISSKFFCMYTISCLAKQLDAYCSSSQSTRQVPRQRFQLHRPRSQQESFYL
jgi:hypothetical protein